MKAKQEIKDLSALLAEDFVVAVQPDHPFLSVGPDLLISKDGNLGALFVLKSDEAESPDRLLIRLALSRLALPNHMRCVLVLDPFDLQSRDMLQSHFHWVFSAGHYEDLAAFLMHPDASTRVRPVPADIKERTFQRFDALYTESQERVPIEEHAQEPTSTIREEDLFGFERVRVPSWTGQQSAYHRQAEILERGSTFLAQVKVGSRGNVLDKIRTFCRASVLLDYSLDVGIPYPRDYSFRTAKIMLVDKLPTPRGDPFKPIRAAAFAGWAVVRFRSGEDIEDIGRSIRVRLESRRDEPQQ